MAQAQTVERQTVTKQEAAEILGLNLRTITRMIGRGELESIKLGTRRLIPRRVIDALLNGEQPQDEAVSDGT